MTDKDKKQDQDDQNNQNQDQDKEKEKEKEKDKGTDEGKKDAKFTQDDLNSFAAKVRAEEKAKYEKLKADADRKAELEKMEENDRLKAEKEDAEKKLQELEAQVKYNNDKTAAIAKLSEAKLDSRLIDVLMSDKSNEEKIKLMADIQKEVVDKAIKEAMPSHKPNGKGADEKTGFDSDVKVKYGFEKFK